MKTYTVTLSPLRVTRTLPHPHEHQTLDATEIRRLLEQINHRLDLLELRANQLLEEGPAP